MLQNDEADVENISHGCAGRITGQFCLPSIDDGGITHDRLEGCKRVGPGNEASCNSPVY